ncbi:MFS transporter [Candidatus Microgenomates bacterium]|nr:MFS transporter [Candidatus Microgenomates bacterium]
MNLLALKLVNSPFKFIWINQILLQVAQNMLNFALLILVFQLTNSNTLVSVFILSISFPAILFGGFAGVVADMVDKRKLIIFCDLGMAAAALFLFFTHTTYVFILLASLILNSFVQFFIPAEGSAIPMLVKRNQLLAANSLFFFTLYSALISGYTMAGPLINLLGNTSFFLVVAILFVTGALFSRFLPSLRSNGRINFGRGYRQAFGTAIDEMVSGWTFVMRHRLVLGGLALLAVVQGMIAIVATLVPGYFERELKIAATESYIVLGPLGIGLLLGALLVERFGKKMSKRFMVIRAVLVCGVVLTVIGLLPVLASIFDQTQFIAQRPRPFTELFSVASFFAFLSFILGFFVVQIVIPAQTVIQEYSSEEYRGRVFSILGIASSVAIVFASFVVGSLADLLGILPVLVAVGVLIFIIGLVGFSLKNSFNLAPS